MTHNSWILARQGKFTASNTHKLLVSSKSKDVIFGQTAISYIKEVAAENLAIVEQKASTKAMEWGTFHEPHAMEMYRKFTGKEVEYFGVENPLFIENSEYSGGSPDGLTDTHLIEIKCPFNTANHIENLTLTEDEFKKERAEYYAQIQFNMLLTKRSKAHFVSFDPRMIHEDRMLCVLEINEDKVFQNIITQRIALAEIELRKIITKIIKL